MNEYINLLTNQFRFLVDELGFNISTAKFEPENFGNCIIRLETSKVGVNIVLDRGQLFIYIGQRTKVEDEWFDIRDVIKYFAPHIEPVYIFPEELTGQANILFQARRLADLIKTYCTPLLQGDFSMENDIRNIQLKRVEIFEDEMRNRYPHLDSGKE